VTGAQLRSLGRAIESCGFSRSSAIRPLGVQSRKRWHIRDRRREWLVFDGDKFTVFFTGSINECEDLDSAYCAASKST